MKFNILKTRNGKLRNKLSNNFPKNKLTDKDIDQLMSIVEDYEKANLATIEKLKTSGKATGLVTTRGNKSRDRLLTHHGFDGLFDVIVGRGDAERRKPHPQPIAMALEKLGIVHPNRALYVGDLQIDDVGAGRALGMKTALVNDQPLDAHGPVPTYHWKNLQPLARIYGR